MTRREVFLQADPHVIHEKIGFVEIDWDGKIERFSSKRPFHICRSLNWFAHGELYDLPKEVVLEKIIKENSTFKFTEWQLNSVYQNREGILYAAVKALGLSNEPKVDELINRWLDESVSIFDDSDINSTAANIISELIKNQKDQENY